jgi:hypothetical protein
MPGTIMKKYINRGKMNKHGNKCMEQTTCDLGYIIKDHIKSLIQILTNELPQYNFRLQTTKCLNTAVMMMLFFLDKKGLVMADYCDTQKVIKRHNEGVDNNLTIMKSLKRNLFNPNEKKRTIYYILLSDGYFPQQDKNKSDNVYFPGHVFILEKIWDEPKKKHFFQFYQSYINKYTLGDHIKMNKGLTLSLEKTKQIILNLEEILEARIWDKENVKKWKLMTFVDSANFYNTLSKQKFFVCYQKAKSNTCIHVLRRLCQRIRKELLELPQSDMTDIYGDKELYDEDSMPLTNEQILTSTQQILKKVINSTRN